MLQINTNFGLDAFEDGLAAIGSGETVLQLPNRIAANAVGNMTALLQLIVTWSRQAADQAVLRLHATTADDIALENFAGTPFGITALNMAKAIELVSGEGISRRTALEFARDYVIQMHEGEIDKLRDLSKTILPILCIDNAKDFRRPAKLYDRNTGKVLGRTDFEDLIRDSYDTLLLTKGRLDLKQHVQPMASLLFEAFQNTHEHAQTDFLGNRYRRSTRGVLFAHQTVAVSELMSMAGQNRRIEEHFSRWRPKRTGAKYAKFAEISVFDSGPGLADNWLGKRGEISRSIKLEPISIADEYSAVLACLRKGSTTKSSSTRGNGLFRIMEVVKRSGGLIRIRSGRLALIKAFDLSQRAESEVQDIEMEDSRKGGIPTHPLPWADGTSISVMIPLNRGY